MKKILPLLLFLFTALVSNAQNLTINFSDCTIEEAMSQLKNEGISFILKSDSIDMDAKVNANFTEASLETIVRKIFDKQNVSLIISDSVVVVSAKSEPAQTMKKEQEVRKTEGKIVDSEGIPVSGASIFVQDTNVGTVSGYEGDFSISLEKESTLVVSCLSYATKHIKATPGQKLTIVLEDSAEFLEEVVLVGYGTQKKVNLTGAVATISTDAIAQRPVENVSQALQGLIPGLNIAQSSGLLDSNPMINIRGIGTIAEGSSAAPLVLIDGTEGNINTINPQDIESISVLKDAASSSIYGSRAPFGVILITTKSGSDSKTTVNYSNNFRWAGPTFWPRILNSYDFVTLANDACRNSNVADFFNPDQVERIKKYINGEITTVSIQNPDNPKYWADGYLQANANVNCFKEYFKDNSFSQEHNVSMRGGNKKYSFYMSMGFLDQHGLLSVTDDIYQRFTPSAKITANLTDWMKATYSLRYNRTSYDRPIYLNQSLFADWARQSWPEVPTYDDNGYIYMDNEQLQLMVNGGRAREITDNLNNHFILTLQPFKNWVTNAELNYNTQVYTQNMVRLMTYAHDYNGDAFVRNSESYVQNSTVKSNHLNLNVYSTYDFQLARHNFKLMAGFQYENYATENFGIKNVGVINADLAVIDLTTGYTYDGKPVAPSIWGNNASWATAGYFARFNYDFDERYLFEANLRYDGSSRFRAENRWAWFPSVSAGWNIANEPFWESLSDYVNTLKLRVSYGSLGNQNIGNWYPTYQKMGVYINNGGWLQNGKATNTAYSPELISSSLTWETIKSYNLGLDLGAFNNRLTSSVELYSRYTTNMIGPAQELPSVLGASVPRSNNTDLRTYGFDLELQWKDNLDCGLFYGIRFILSDNQTEILRYPNDSKLLMTNGIYSYYPGSYVGDFWGLKTLGIAQTDQEMKAHLATLPHGGQSWLGTDWRAGDIMYADLDGNGVISMESGTLEDHGDLIKLGNDQPRYQFGLDLNASWKGFDMRVFFQGVGKRDFWPGYIAFWASSNPNIWYMLGFEEHLDYFRNTPSGNLDVNLDSYYPRPLLNAKNQYMQTKYVQDASYIRLKNLTFGYTIPQKYTQRFKVSNLRLFFSGENLWTGTRLSTVFDPEGINGNDKISGIGYPIMKTWSCGLTITL